MNEAIEISAIQHHICGMKRRDLRAKNAARLDRQFKLFERRFPRAKRPMRALSRRQMALVRMPIAILMIVGGLFAILPFLGLWMIPMGLLLLAIDFPVLKGPVSGAIIRARRWWETRSFLRRR